MSEPNSPDSDAAGGRPTLPDALAIASELWVVVIVGQIIAFAAQFGSFDDAIREQAAETSGASAEQIEFMTSTGFVVATVVLTGVVLTAIPLLVLWLTRRGHNWARVLLSAIGVFIVVNALLSMFGEVDPVWAMAPTLISAVAALGATVLLMRSDTYKYCQDMAEFRRKPAVAAAPYPYPPTAYPPTSYPGYQPYGQGSAAEQAPADPGSYGGHANGVPPAEGHPQTPAGHQPPGHEPPGHEPPASPPSTEGQRSSDQP